MVHCQALGHSRRRSEGKRWREKYVSLNLVYFYWANLGVIAKSVMHEHLTIFRTIVLGIIGSIIGGRRYPHVFAPDKRTISSRRPHFFYTGRDPGSLYFL